jgi:hypothetical protein
VASAVCVAAGYPLGQTIQGIIVKQWSLHWAGYASALATFGLFSWPGTVVDVPLSPSAMEWVLSCMAL